MRNAEKASSGGRNRSRSLALEIVDENRRVERSVLEQAESGVEDRVLALGISRRSERIAVAERDEERTRRADAFSYLAQELDRHGCDSVTLELGCHQAHGLVAEGSNGDQ